MKTPRNPAREAAESRDLANRARRLALRVSDPHDQDRINLYAQELERRALELEAEARGAGPVPTIRFEQHQAQQQSGSEPKNSDPS